MYICTVRGGGLHFLTTHTYIQISVKTKLTPKNKAPLCPKFKTLLKRILLHL